MVTFENFDEHPRQLYMGVPPPPPPQDGRSFDSDVRRNENKTLLNKIINCYV